MSRLTVLRISLGALAFTLAASSTVWAQGTSSIAGTVADATGAVMPGVTVEASSPALIEKVRSVVTDGQGLYKIIDLLPGTYSVTFSLAGFSTIKRDGIELTSNFTANVDAQMRVGALEETIIVSGQSPVVDVQNVVQHTVVSRQQLFALPISKEMAGYAAITPGAVLSPTSQDVGGNKDQGNFAIHGSKTQDGRQLLDGMRFNAEDSGRGFRFNPGAAQEISIELGGNSAESEIGGVQVNLIPKEGGNLFTGFFNTNYTNKNLQANNFNDTLRSRGVTTINTVRQIHDLNVSFGGPIVRDRLWFYTSHRFWGYSNYIANNYYNKTQGSMFYTPDLSRRAFVDETDRSQNIRLTWQASQRNKINFSWDFQDNCICHTGINALVAPEASAYRFYRSPNYLLLAKWTFPVTNKLLVEAGGAALLFDWPNFRQPGVGKDDISILEQSNNYRYGAALMNSYGHRIASQSNQRFSVSYVSGSHAFRTGLFMQEGWHRHQFAEPTLVSGIVDYTFLNKSPISLTEWAGPIELKERAKLNLGIFVQDQWTIKNLTLNMGLRYDSFNAFIPEQHLSAGPFVPARDFSRIDCTPCWKDLDPRLGASLDVFGNGKTAVKGNLGRFVAAELFVTARANNPVQTSVLSTTRTWGDANLNYIPDCDLTNPAANLECGAINNVNFGKTDPRATTYAPDVLTGWGHRNYSWQASGSIQQELRPGMAINLGYFRTWYGSFQATDNLSVTPGDYDQFSIVAPTDPRLPGSGAVIGGLYDVSVAKFGQFKNVVTQAANFGPRTEVYNGVDVTLQARLKPGSVITGGLNTGQTVTENCAVIDSPQTRFCKTTLPWSGQTQLKLSGTYSLPWDLQTGFTYQNLPGIPVTATYVATNAEIAPTLGRNLSAGARGTVTVDLIEPNTDFEKRITQLDVRATRTFRVGKARLQGIVDLYNVLNSSSILSINTRFGSAWLTPTEILAGRLLKFGVQIDY